MFAANTDMGTAARVPSSALLALSSLVIQLRTSSGHDRVDGVPVHGTAGVDLGRRDLQHVGDLAHERVEDHLGEARGQRRSSLFASGSLRGGDARPHGQWSQTRVGEGVQQAQAVGDDEVCGSEAGAHLRVAGLFNLAGTVALTRNQALDEGMEGGLADTDDVLPGV